MKAPSLMWRSLFSLYRKLRRISYKAKKRSAWIALRRNRICRFASRRRRRILLRRNLFLLSGKLQSRILFCCIEKEDSHRLLTCFGILFLG